MARQEVVCYTYMCDVCGAEIPEEDAGTASRKFSWAGADYLIDACAEHQMELTETLDQLKDFVDVGRRAGTGRRGAARSTTNRSRARGRSAAAGGAAGRPRRSDIGAIRAWAQANGYQLGDRGRVPASIVSDYDTARNSEGATEADGGTRAPVSAQAAERAPTDEEMWGELAMEESGSSARA